MKWGIIADPFSDLKNVHHDKLGKFGLVMDVDCDTEVSFIDDAHTTIRAPPHLLESHQIDRPFTVPTNAAAEETHEVQIGDAAEVKFGPHCGLFGMVEIICGKEVRIRPVGMERSCVYVSIKAAKFRPPSNALKYSAEYGYNVRSGDAVLVVQGRWVGKRGIVGVIDLQNKTLEVNAWPKLVRESIFVPITYVSHESLVSERDETQRYMGKEVLIIRGHYKGWQGTLISVSQDQCEVAPGNAPACVLNKKYVIARGCSSTLSGQALSHAQLVAVMSAFKHGDNPERTARQKTPPPVAVTPDAPLEPSDLSTDAWTVNADDIRPNEPLLASKGVLLVDMHELTIYLSELNFMMHPEVKAVLQTHHAIFRVGNTWHAGYLKRLCQTNVPDPFQSVSGSAVPSLHLAVHLTSKRPGGKNMYENIHERHLTPYAPSKSGTYCMIIKTKEGGQGESIGMILSVTTSSRKTQRVSVV
ncbi:hypothetical protein JVT61DRAFT_11893 [Boletus reticuloceps]|uniref:KOW domain-containing protein n=1 Tax=Boletus reticuloceps TaxID=495285 RepID=A0A8I2YWP7_9AGAM|nr:hypothetical protein JVT61DRAFT_11893 [Boletus reticuloceps]